MKVLFLDIDGVLNRRGTAERCDGFIGCDRVLAKLLTDWLAQHPDVSVVLSSSWRIVHAWMPDAFPHLHEAGIFWIDVTPCLNDHRGLEIQAWLTEHPEVTKYAILDDNSDMLPHQLTSFVQTDYVTGLVETDLLRLSAILED